MDEKSIRRVELNVAVVTDMVVLTTESMLIELDGVTEDEIALLAFNPSRSFGMMLGIVHVEKRSKTIDRLLLRWPMVVMGSAVNL